MDARINEGYIITDSIQVGETEFVFGNNGQISYVQYVENGCVYFTDSGLQEYIAKCTHRAKPVEKNSTYRTPRRSNNSKSHV